MSDERVNGRPPWAAVAFGALLLAAMLLRIFAWSEYHRFPMYDELDYLRLARDFAGRGGLATFATDLVSGAMKEDNRHPLFVALLVPFMRATPGDFVAAKLAAAATGVFLFGAAVWVGRRRGGGSAAVLGVWVAFSATVAYHGHTAAPDLLFTALYLLAVRTAVEAGEDRRRWGVFGLLAGLAWLTKGNGHFLLLVPFAVAAWRRGRRALAHPGPWASLAGFAAGGCLLLVRNVRVWGTPFHQAGQKWIWLDDADVFVRLQNSPVWDEIGFGWYLRTHTLSEALPGLLRGVVAGVTNLCRALAAGPSGEAWESGIGAAMLALALVGVRRAWLTGRRDEVLAAAVPGAALCAAFSLLAKTGTSFPRFYLPVAATLVPFAWDVLREAGRGSRVAAPAALTACALAAVGTGVVSWGALDRPVTALGPLPPFWTETSRWLAANAPGRYGVDFRSLYSRWDSPPDERVVYDFAAPPEEARAFLERAGARWVVVDRAVAAAPDASGPSSEFLGWPLCYRAPREPNPLAVYGAACPAAAR